MKSLLEVDCNFDGRATRVDENEPAAGVASLVAVPALFPSLVSCYAKRCQRSTNDHERHEDEQVETKIVMRRQPFSHEPRWPDYQPNS